MNRQGYGIGGMSQQPGADGNYAQLGQGAQQMGGQLHGGMAPDMYAGGARGGQMMDQAGMGRGYEATSGTGGFQGYDQRAGGSKTMQDGQMMDGSHMGMQAPGMQAPGMQPPGMQPPSMLPLGMQQPGMQGMRGQEQALGTQQQNDPGMLPGMQLPGMQPPGMQQPGMSNSRGGVQGMSNGRGRPGMQGMAQEHNMQQQGIPNGRPGMQAIPLGMQAGQEHLQQQGMGNVQNQQVMPQGMAIGGMMQQGGYQDSAQQRHQQPQATQAQAPQQHMQQQQQQQQQQQRPQQQQQAPGMQQGKQQMAPGMHGQMAGRPGQPGMLPQGMLPQGMQPPGMQQAMPQGMTQGMPPQGMRGMPQGMSQGMPQGMPQGMTQGMTQGAAPSMPPGAPGMGATGMGATGMAAPGIGAPGMGPAPDSAASQITSVGNPGGNTNCYPQIVKLRQQQQSVGVDLSELSAVQLGLFPIPRCHHITKTLQTMQGLPSYRVRICKRCSGGNAHIELGTYADQESAIIVNDAHEILYGRTNRLLVLVPGDEEFFSSLMLRRFCRGRIEMHRLTEVLREKLVVDAIKQSSRRKRANESDKAEEESMIVLQPLRERRGVITKAVEDACRNFVIPVLVSNQIGNWEEPEELLEQLMLEGFSETTQYTKKPRRTPQTESDALEAAFASHLILFLGAYSSLSVTDLKDVTERILAVFPSTDKAPALDILYSNIEDFKEKTFSKLQALLDEGLRTLPVYCGSAVDAINMLKTPRWLQRSQGTTTAGARGGGGGGGGDRDKRFEEEHVLNTFVTESALLRKYYDALPTSRPRRITEAEWLSVEVNLARCRSLVQHALARRAIAIGFCAVELQEKRPGVERLQLALDTMKSVMDFISDRSTVEQVEVRVVHCMLLDTLVKNLRSSIGRQPAGLAAQFRDAVYKTLSLCKNIGLFSSREPATPEAEKDARRALGMAGGTMPDAKLGSGAEPQISVPTVLQRNRNFEFDSSANKMQQEYRVLVLSVVLSFCSAIGECNLNMQLAEGVLLSEVMREGADAADWLEHACSSEGCCLLLSTTGRAFVNATKTCLDLAQIDSNFTAFASSIITIAGTICQFCAARFLCFGSLVAEVNDVLAQVNERLDNNNKRRNKGPETTVKSSNEEAAAAPAAAPAAPAAAPPATKEASDPRAPPK